jgi:hypothetical protein
MTRSWKGDSQATAPIGRKASANLNVMPVLESIQNQLEEILFEWGTPRVIFRGTSASILSEHLRHAPRLNDRLGATANYCILIVEEAGGDRLVECDVRGHSRGS